MSDDLYNRRKLNYNKIVFDNQQDKPVKPKNTLQSNAYKTAIKTRQFEIELFWKRALFFFGFITASFTAYWKVYEFAKKKENLLFIENICADNITRITVNPNSDIDSSYKLILIFISIVIFILCAVFNCSCRGSKFWQENWEFHIDYLEDEISGKLYKTWKPNEKCLLNPFGKYNFSLSKLAIGVSFIFELASIFLVMFSVNLFCKIPFIEFFRKLFFENGKIFLFFMFIFLLITVTHLFLYLTCKGNATKNSKSNSVTVHKYDGTNANLDYQ